MIAAGLVYAWFIAVVGLFACVAIRRIRARHAALRSGPPPQDPKPITLEEYIMSLSTQAQALADELATVPALIAAKVAEAVAEANASSAADLAALKAAVDPIVANLQPAAPAVEDAEVVVEQLGGIVPEVTG